MPAAHPVARAFWPLVFCARPRVGAIIVSLVLQASSCPPLALVLAVVCPLSIQLLWRHLCSALARVLALVCPLSVQLLQRHVCPVLAVVFFFSPLLRYI